MTEYLLVKALADPLEPPRQRPVGKRKQIEFGAEIEQKTEPKNRQKG